FSCSCRHLDLHSFPTRRSSDLAVVDVIVEEVARYLRLKRAGERLLRAECEVSDTQKIRDRGRPELGVDLANLMGDALRVQVLDEDRKSTRLNSSHLGISYAVFC